MQTRVETSQIILFLIIFTYVKHLSVSIDNRSGHEEYYGANIYIISIQEINEAPVCRKE